MYYLLTELMGVLSSSSSKDFLDQVSVLFQIARCPLQCSDSKPPLIRHSATTTLLSALTVMIWMSSKHKAMKKGCQLFILSFSYDLVLSIWVIITSSLDRSIYYFQRLSKFWFFIFISRVLSPQGRIKHWHNYFKYWSVHLRFPIYTSPNENSHTFAFILVCKNCPKLLMEVAAPEKFAASAVNSHCGEASVGQTGGVWDYFDALAWQCTGVQNQISIKD